MAHSHFCLGYPTDCEVHRGFRQQSISLTPERWAELVAVNRQIDRAIMPQPIWAA
jgi:predicted transglutaminase-like cysteine proteinase